MVTTIQVSDGFKKQLAQAKGMQTYEQFLKELLRRHQRMIVAEQMVDYGVNHGDDELASLREWEGADVQWK